MFNSEPGTTGAPKARLYFVSNKQPTMPANDVNSDREIFLRRNNEASRTEDCFGKKTSNNTWRRSDN